MFHRGAARFRRDFREEERTHQNQEVHVFFFFNFTSSRAAFVRAVVFPSPGGLSTNPGVAWNWFSFMAIAVVLNDEILDMFPSTEN